MKSLICPTLLLITCALSGTQVQAQSGLYAAEISFYECVLKEARASEFGNPMVAAYHGADQCPSEDLQDEQRERAIGAVVRRLMKEVGMDCIGTGC